MGKANTKTDGSIKIWIDGDVHINMKLPSQWNQNVGTFGLFVAYSQIEFKNGQFMAPKQAITPAPANGMQTFKPVFKDFVEGGFANGETGNGNNGKCKGGDWTNQGSYWAQPACNSGAAWFINKKLMKANYDYEFSVNIKNADNDDSGVVFRFQDKNNFIRFHHTLQNVYNKNAKWRTWINGGCTGPNSFVVVRKGGKEYCAKKTGWKYVQNRYHSFKVNTKTDGSIKIWIDGNMHINMKLPSQWNQNVGTFGLFVAYCRSI